MVDDLPAAAPKKPVLSNRREMAEAFGEWFANATVEERKRSSTPTASTPGHARIIAVSNSTTAWTEWTAMNNSSSRTLPEIPGVVLHDTKPGRLALRPIEKAYRYGWKDEPAEAVMLRGRDALCATRWKVTPGWKPNCSHTWLAGNATPGSCELRDYDEVIVLIGRSDIL